MSLELRTVNTGKLALAVDQNATAAAHARAHTAAHDHHGAKLLDFRRLTKRSDNIQDAVPGVERVQEMSSLANRLHHHVDGAAYGVGFLNRQRNALSLFVQPEDDELPRPMFSRDPRSFDDKALDTRSNELRMKDFEHGLPATGLQIIVPRRGTKRL